MHPDHIKDSLRLYIELQQEISKLVQKMNDLTDQSHVIGQVLFPHIPETFIFPWNGIFYEFVMDPGEGIISSFEELESLDGFLAKKEAAALKEDAIDVYELFQDGGGVDA